VIRGLASLALVLVVAACGGAAVPPATAPAASGPPATAMPAGTYTSTSFGPALTFTVPAGWEVANDSSGYLELRPLGSVDAGIHVFRDIKAASQAADCPTSAEPGVGATSSELIAWMRGLKGVNASPVSMAAVGDLRGVSIDLSIAAGWTQACPFANGLPTVPLFTDGANLRWVLAGNERLRLFILDTPGGGTITVDVDAFDGTLFEGILAQATPIIRTFSFAVGG
jgi:hypothetical protein